MKTKRRVAAATILRAGLAALAALPAGSVHAAPVYWAEWQTGTVGPEGTARGTMKIGAATVKVDYKGLAGKGRASALATAGSPGGGGRQASPSRSSRHCSGPKTTGAGDPIDIKLGGDLLFYFDKATLRPEADGMLSEVAQQLRELGGRPLLIEGHTDDAGTEPYNRKLSQARAAAVAEWMATKGGIEAGCMRAVGYWYSRPAAPNDSEEGRQKNRRVEIHSDRTPAAGGPGTEPLMPPARRRC